MDPPGRDGSGYWDSERTESGHGRGRGPWTPNAHNVGETSLRRPHDAKSFKLSATAAEFVPKSVTQINAQPVQSVPQTFRKYSAQDRLVMAREIPNQTSDHMSSQHHSVVQAPYYQTNYESFQAEHRNDQQEQFQVVEGYSPYNQINQYENFQECGYYDGGAGDYTDRYQGSSESGNMVSDVELVMHQLDSAMHTLTFNPGQFDVLVLSLIKNIRPILEYPSQFQKMMDAVIRKSIIEGNFRYSGARLCTSLDSSMTPTEQESYRKILVALCKEEIQTLTINWDKRNEHTDEESKKCHGLILFLAELVTQMEDAPASELGELLVELITVVLKKPAPNSAKHICQALKLAGQTLERDKRGSRTKMENMMRALTQLVTEGRVDQHVGRMVDNVHELRNGNWGQGMSSNYQPPTDTVQQDKFQQVTDEPIMYGPDGSMLSVEESQFLQEYLGTADEPNDHAGPINEYANTLEEDEDDMIAAAYENVFLKMLHNKSQDNAR